MKKYTRGKYTFPTKKSMTKHMLESWRNNIHWAAEVSPNIGVKALLKSVCKDINREIKKL